MATFCLCIWSVFCYAMLMNRRELECGLHSVMKLFSLTAAVSRMPCCLYTFMKQFTGLIPKSFKNSKSKTSHRV